MVNPAGGNKRVRGNNGSQSPQRVTRTRGAAGAAAAAPSPAETAHDSDEEVANDPTTAAANTTATNKPSLLACIRGHHNFNDMLKALHMLGTDLRKIDLTVDSIWDHYSMPTRADIWNLVSFVTCQHVPKTYKDFETKKKLEQDLADAKAQLAAARDQLKEINNSVVMPIFIGEVVRLVDAKCYIPNIKSCFYLSKVACRPQLLTTLGGVDEKHPFVKSMWDFVFKELEKPFCDMGGKVPVAGSIDSCNVYTNGQPHPWNTPIKHKELWLSTKLFGSDKMTLSASVLKKWSTKRNHLASWYRKRFGMCWMSCCLALCEPPF